MTKADLIAQVAANTEMTKKDADKAVNAMFEALSNALAAPLRCASVQSARASTPAPTRRSPFLLPVAWCSSRANPSKTFCNPSVGGVRP